MSQRKNHSSKLAFCIPNDELLSISKTCKCSPKILNQGLYSYQTGIGLLPNHFLYDLTEDVMQRFIPMGIIQYMHEFHKWMNFRTDINKPSNEPTVLTIDDVAFGFYICIGACGVSIIAFIVEILIFGLKKIIEKCIAGYIVIKIFRGGFKMSTL